MQEFSVKFQVRDDLVLNGQLVTMPNPRFHIGQKVYRDDLSIKRHPIDWEQQTVAAIIQDYKLQENSEIELENSPKWSYILRNKRGELYLKTLDESCLIDEVDRLSILQEAINDDGLEHTQKVQLFIEYDLVISTSDIKAMWLYLDSCEIQYQATNLKETAKTYLTHQVTNHI